MSGFVLNIDQKLINQLTQADALVKQLGVTSERTREQFNKAFSDMATIGVDGLIKRLTEAQTKIAELGGSMSTGNGLGTISTQATQSTDAINRLIQTLTQLSSTLATSQQQQPLLKITEQDLGAGRMKAIKKAQMDEMVAQQQAASKMQIQIIKGEVATQIETLKSGYAVQIQEAKNAGAEKVRLAKVEAANIAASTQKQTNQVRVNARLEIAAFKDSQQAITNYHKAMAMSEQGVMSRQTKLARLSSVLKELQREENKYGNEIERVKAKMAALREEQGLIKKVGNSLADMLKKIFAFNTIKNFVKKLVQIRGEYEQQHRAMQVLLQDYNKANIIWNKTVQLAVRSPYTIQQLTSYTKQLAAYRIESDKLYDTTKRLADISVGLGVDMQRIILAYGQVRAANFLRGTELRQFTEAGIPMLDELAKYFSAVEHTTVTAAQVFDRISKRQVLFTDVDAVIQKMTDAGGIFYNMQEAMANTLAGMSSNLKDKVYLMFNEIGAQTQGLLSSMLKLLGWLTENWRVLATVLEMLLLPAVTKMIFGFIRAIKKMKLMRVTSLHASGGLVKLASTWKGLASLMLTTPIGLMITLVLTLGAAMYELNNRTKAMNAELDKMRANTQKQITNLEEQKQKVEENNRIIKDSENATNLTEEAETKLAEARAENTRILDELKKRHPDFYKNIIQQKNGTVELTGAIEEQNKQLARQAVFANLVKGSWFSQSLIKNSELFTKRVAEVQRNLDESIAEYEAERANIQEKQAKKKITDDYAKQEISRINAEITNLNAVKERLNNLNAETMTSLEVLSRPSIGNRRSYSEQQYYAILEAAQNAYANLEDVKKIMAQDLREMTASGMSQEDMAEHIHDSLSPLIADTDLLSLIESELNNYFLEVKAIDVPLNFNFNIPPEEIDQWQKNYNKAITEAISEINKDLEDSDKVYFTEITVGTSVANSRDKLIKDAQEAYSQQTDLLKRVRKTAKENNDSLIGTAYEGYSIKNIEAQIELQKKILDFFNAPYTKGKQKNENEEQFKRQLELIKKLRSEYLKLNKEMGKEDALKLIEEHYKDAFDQIFQGTGVDWNLIFDASEQGYVTALGELRPLAEKAGKAAQDAFEKELSGATINVETKTKSDANKQLKQQVDSLFAQFDLSRELEKLGLSKGLMKSLFDVEYLDLDSLKSQVIEKFAGTSTELQTELGKEVSTIDWAKMGKLIGEERAKEAKQSIEKITDMEAKAAKERVKTYVKYLMEAQREAVKIKVEELRKLKEIEESKEFSPEQKQEIKDRVRKETNAELQKQEWADFQNSEMYTMMFEDLEHYGTQALETLREKLIALKGSLTDLPASEVKEIINQLSKIEDITIERNPFRALKETRKQIKAEDVSEEQAQTNLAQSENKIAKLQSELDIINIVNTAKSKGLAIDKETQYAYDDIVAEAEEMGVAENEIVATKEKELKLEKQNAQTARQQAKNYADRDKERIAALNKTKSILGSVQDATKASMELMDSLGVSSDSIGYTLAESADGMISLTLSAIEFGIQMETVGYQSNMALGIIGWIAIGIQTVAKVLSTIFKMHDAGLQKQIDKLAEQTEVLKEKFDALSEAVDNAYNTDQLRTAAAEGKQYTEQMISNYEKMKQLEEDKKKTDKDAVKEYEDNIKEQREALRELEQQIVSEATAGIFDNVADAASGFVDAWYEAFKETGDGLKGLEDNFDEMFLNLAKQQATMQIAGNFAKQWERDLSKYINETDTELTKADAQKWAEEVKATFPALNDALEGFLGVVTEGVGATGELSGLQAGIQGITESQAEILTAYANSCRFLLSSINTTLSDFATKVFDTEGDSNPILSQLRIVAQQTTAINSLLSSLTKGGHTEGGLGLKVFIN